MTSEGTTRDATSAAWSRQSSNKQEQHEATMFVMKSFIFLELEIEMMM
jgi:hypothetical protein